jgi:hypothetical protein
MLRAVLHKMTVQEFAAVIGIQPEQDEGQATSNEFQCVEHVVLALARSPTHSVQPLATSVATNVNKY